MKHIKVINLFCILGNSLCLIWLGYKYSINESNPIWLWLLAVIINAVALLMNSIAVLTSES